MADTKVANTKMYLWESVNVAQGFRSIGSTAKLEYQRMIAEDWAPGARVERGMTLVATWGVTGMFGPWPWCLNLWEHEGWPGVARILTAQYFSEQHTVDLDKRLEGWFGRANKIRTYVRDRILAPSDSTPTLEALLAAKVSGKVYYHECVQVKPGRAREYQDRLHAEWQPHAERLGMRLVGCYRTQMRNDAEVINLWALRDFRHWADVELALRSDAAAKRWNASTTGLADDWRTWLMTPDARSPLQMGRLP
jgi:hypothetical protein